MIHINEKDPVVQSYRAALGELQGLRNELGRVSNEIDTKTQKLVARRQRSQAERLVDEGQAMLSSGVVHESSGLMGEIHELEHRREVIETAIEMQCQIVDRVRGPYSLLLNESQRARHREIVSRIAKGVREVATGFDDEIRLFDELTQAEAAVMLRPMRVNIIGSLRDQNSVATFFIRELKQHFPEINL